MKIARIALLLSMFSGLVIAEEVKIVGTVTQSVKIPRVSMIKSNIANRVEKITLLKVELSDKAKKALALKAKNALSHTKQFAANQEISAYPGKVDLGMNNVPVLNQGRHGTCVTFAVTAALDALLNKGDYVSQLCSLQLGNYLEKNAYFPSGWEGTFGHLVLSQIATFGIVSKQQEQTLGCGGLNTYPIDDESNVKGAISIEDYHQMSENLNENITWSPILDVNNSLLDRINSRGIVRQVKAALHAGDRLTFGVLLIDFDSGFMGALGKKQTQGDTWVLTPEIARHAFFDGSSLGAHEMIITGYDDNAVAIDDKGEEHRGLFTLRNSWGDKVGDQGNFYMSYDYFKLFVIEVARLRDISDSNSQ